MSEKTRFQKTIEMYQMILASYLANQVPHSQRDIQKVQRMIELLKQGQDPKTAADTIDKEFKGK